MFSVRRIIAASLGILLGACATTHFNHFNDADYRSALSLLEAALSRPMTDLYAEARIGQSDARGIFGLAVSAGRDTALLDDPARHVSNIARSKAEWSEFYITWVQLADEPSDEDIARWVKLTRRQLQCCMLDQQLSDAKAEADSAYAAYLKLNDPNMWRFETNSGQGPPNPVVIAELCTSELTMIVHYETALVWLEADAKIATERRAKLGGALRDELRDILDSIKYSTQCPAQKYQYLHDLLIAHRPELGQQVADYLTQRLDDPRLPTDFH